jgi:uncharacterized tellurite resistance protein B-like protein
MSFFGKLFGDGEQITSLSSEESFVGILYAIIAADGQITNEEGEDFMKMVSRAKIMRKVNNNQWRDMINKLHKVLKKSGAEGLVNLAVQNIPEDIKAGVFAYACDLVFSDGHADEEEQKLLDIIKKELSIDDDLAYKVAEVVMIKNKL